MQFKSCIDNKKTGCYSWKHQITVNMHPCLNKEIVEEIWCGFCFNTSEIIVKQTDKYIFSTGEVQSPELNGYDYAIEVEEDGFAVSAIDEQNLLYGFLELLSHIEAVNLEYGHEQFCIPCLSIKDKPAIQNRMVHLCVFPETDAEFIEKFIKLCGMLRYNYLVIEFWGMLRFDCFKELSWECAFTKEQARSFMQLANDLGMEVIPMLNHWGHASFCRVVSGKHVVLDQNPRLQLLFNETGWVWNIKRPEVRTLMKQIRKELIDLCGEGKYFHIGCDEAYGFENMSTEDLMVIIDYIKEIVDDLELYGRRPIMWGDMLLYNRYTSENSYYCYCGNEKNEQLLMENLDRRIITADWQYNATNYPVETAVFFQKKGFDVLCCPWDRTKGNIDSSVETVKNYNLFGIMHTTWHTLQEAYHGLPYVYYDAVASWNVEHLNFTDVGYAEMSLNTAAMLRRCHSAKGNYENAGFVARQNEDFVG